MDSAYWIFAMQTLVKIQNKNLSVFVREERWSKENISPVKNKILYNRDWSGQKECSILVQNFFCFQHILYCVRNGIVFVAKTYLKCSFQQGYLWVTRWEVVVARVQFPRKAHLRDWKSFCALFKHHRQNLNDRQVS